MLKSYLYEDIYNLKINEDNRFKIYNNFKHDDGYKNNEVINIIDLSFKDNLKYGYVISFYDKDVKINNFFKFHLFSDNAPYYPYIFLDKIYIVNDYELKLQEKFLEKIEFVISEGILIE